MHSHSIDADSAPSRTDDDAASERSPDATAAIARTVTAARHATDELCVRSQRSPLTRDRRRHFLGLTYFQPDASYRPVSATVRRESCQLLNGVIADSMVLYALYRKQLWSVGGTTSHQHRRLLSRHATEHRELIDLLAERVQCLGGVAVGDPRHAAELTSIERPPDGAEDDQTLLDRLVRAHGVVLSNVRRAIERTGAAGDWRTGDLLGEVLRTNELQAWSDSARLVHVTADGNGRTRTFPSGADARPPGAERRAPAASPAR